MRLAIIAIISITISVIIRLGALLRNKKTSSKSLMTAQSSNHYLITHQLQYRSDEPSSGKKDSHIYSEPNLIITGNSTFSYWYNNNKQQALSKVYHHLEDGKHGFFH